MSNVTIWNFQKEIVLRCYRENTIACDIVGFFGCPSSSVNLKFQNFDQFSQSDQDLESRENFTILTIFVSRLYLDFAILTQSANFRSRETRENKRGEACGTIETIQTLNL